MVFLPPITCSFVECGIEPCGVADAKITLNTVGIGRKRWRSRTEEGDTRVDYYWRLKAPTNDCNDDSSLRVGACTKGGETLDIIFAQKATPR